LAQLGDLWGIRPEDMAAFGDSGNDFEMLKFVGQGYAVENAAPKVKTIADCTIGSNDEDSVLTQIENILDTNQS
jgi:hydroxymethylpyrimidine pyrophosphatase-like HAD family hydrolase